ncbi:hypothetical protein EXN66_Car004962 [Channa argus]|uniref:Uncharacterized protein n=1 Tax=Channa argus TaxID=215402 RepID=A0A6G1PG59_CHAAH|nr:hypothetical protein EXN66_Car004962 [Channa argus]
MTKLVPPALKAMFYLLRKLSSILCSNALCCLLALFFFKTKSILVLQSEIQITDLCSDYHLSLGKVK